MDDKVVNRFLFAQTRISSQFHVYKRHQANNLFQIFGWPWASKISHLSADLSTDILRFPEQSNAKVVQSHTLMTKGGPLPVQG